MEKFWGKNPDSLPRCQNWALRSEERCPVRIVVRDLGLPSRLSLTITRKALRQEWNIPAFRDQGLLLWLSIGAGTGGCIGIARSAQIERSWFPEAICPEVDRKSTRLNSSHRCISYAV